MATDFRVVVPSDLGETIKMGAKEANKYDVDVSKLDLPAGVDSLELNGTTLTVKTAKGDKSVDLAPMLPAITAELFLKNVERNGNDLVFTVGEQGNTTHDRTLRVSVADFLTTVTDNETLTGNGTTAQPLGVKVSTTQVGNLIKKNSDGIYVSPSDLPKPTAEPRTIRLVNASGQTVVGYIYNTEQ